MVNRVLIFSVFTFLFYSTTIHAATFKGRVIDADTKEPIEGAVVVASWYEARATIAGEDTRLRDVKETLTDKNGEWVIKGPRGSKPGNIKAIFTFLTGIYYTRPPLFIVFKPGYCSWFEANGVEVCIKKMKSYNFTNSNNIGEVVELPKLINREDRLRALPGPVTGYLPGEDAWEKQKEFIRLINEESRNIGIPEAYY